MAQIAPAVQQQQASPIVTTERQPSWRPSQLAAKTRGASSRDEPVRSTAESSTEYSVTTPHRSTGDYFTKAPHAYHHSQYAVDVDDAAGASAGGSASKLDNASKGTALHQSHISTVSIGGAPPSALEQSSSSSTAAASGGVMPTAAPLSPTSHNTGSSYRSPTRWTNFEDSDDYDGDGSGKSHSPKLENQTTLSTSDIETQNLLEQEDGMSEEGREHTDDDADEGGSLQQELGSGADPYVMRDVDKIYYTNNFLRMLQKTQNSQDLNGALRGSDPEVLDFFQKSSLSTAALSQIWTLADVNADGWLNLSEFQTAMHLIVLNVKGGIAIPSFLPAHLTPRVTPVRQRVASGVSADFDAPNASSSVTSPPQLRDFSSMPPECTTEAGGGSAAASTVVEKPVPIKHRLPHHSSDDATAPPVFSNSPQASPSRVPLHGGGRHHPTAHGAPPQGVGGPKGPPPPPPPRPHQQQHKRSASLDLSKAPPPQLAAAAAPPRGHLQQQAQSSCVAQAPQQRLPPRTDVSSSPAHTAAAAVTPKRETLPRTGGGLPPLALFDDPRAAPPFPPDNAPPPLPSFDEQRRFFEVREAQTQTGGEGGTTLRGDDAPDVSNLDRRRHPAVTEPKPMMDFEEIEERVAAKSSASDRDWTSRCARLRRSNADLEQQRAKLAQIRLQLELRMEAVMRPPATASAASNAASTGGASVGGQK